MTQLRSARTPTKRPIAQRPDAATDHLQKITATLRGNLEKCASDPGIDPVHDVRTGTRRLQAMVEAILRERGDDNSLQQTADEWLTALKKMRRAAAPVRDLDVHRELLQKLVKNKKKNERPGDEVTATNGVEEAASPVEKQTEHLDAWLNHARQHNSAALKKKAAKLFAKFDDEAAAFEQALKDGPRTRRRPRSAAVVALESFSRLVHEMQHLDANNLHDFRKGAKKARYIAESAAEDAHAIAIGKALKRLQDDIGDWHDWLVLADEARTALGDEGKDLVALLDAERDRHYAVAMKTVNRLRGRLLGEWLAMSQPRRRQPATTRHKSSS